MPVMPRSHIQCLAGRQAGSLRNETSRAWAVGRCAAGRPFRRSSMEAVLAVNATIGSLFYMLVKYQDVSPKQFVCKGDSGTQIFKLLSYSTTVTDLTKVYDFGNKPGLNCSYAYHFPFARAGNGTNAITGFPISVSSARQSRRGE